MTTEKIALTGHELLFLLGMDGSESSKRSRELLELVAIEDSDDYELFGMTTLLARDLATVGETGAQPQGQAMHIAVALLEATNWVRIAAASGDNNLGYIIMRSPDAAIVMLVRELGIYDIVPIDPSADLKDLAIDIVREAVPEVSEGLYCAAQFVTLDAPEVAVNLAAAADEARVNVAVKGQEASEAAAPETVSHAEALDLWAAKVREL